MFQVWQSYLETQIKCRNFSVFFFIDYRSIYKNKWQLLNIIICILIDISWIYWLQKHMTAITICYLSQGLKNNSIDISIKKKLVSQNSLYLVIPPLLWWVQREIEA